MSDYFGPSEMLDEYKNIECDTPDGTAIARVTRYRNANHVSEKGGCQEALIVKDRLRAVAPDAHARAGGSVAYVEAFMGKGSPRAIAAILETFVAYSDEFIAKYGKSKWAPEGKVAAILSNPDISWHETVQQVCDVCFGLDCNGFVGHWLKRVQPDFKFDHNVKSDAVRAKAKTYRKRLAEIEYWDIMAYAKNEHIAVVNTTGSAAGRFEVCQSAGGGPRKNEFAFLEAGRSVVGGQVRQRFKLGAPTRDDIGFDFYVVSLW